MSITATQYQNQLPTICVDLANKTLLQIAKYEQGDQQSDTDTAFLENTFRLLEMYVSGHFVFDNPAGVLGGEISVSMRHVDPATDKKPI